MKLFKRKAFENHFYNICHYLNQIPIFNSWKNGFFRDSKQNVTMSAFIPFALKNVVENPDEDALFQFFLLFNQTWSLENSPQFTEETIKTFSMIEKRLFLFFIFFLIKNII